MMEFVFWQSMISPHQAGLVRALANRKDCTVTYVAAETVEASRAAMGWQEPGLGAATLKLAETPADIAAAAAGFGADALHICQGFRGNGVIEHALPALADRDARIAVMMEAVDRRGPTGWLKKPLYQRRVQRYRDKVEFCLAIGTEAEEFVSECGFPRDRIYPFSYFLSPLNQPAAHTKQSSTHRVLYVGKLIELKRVDLLIEAFGVLNLPDVRLSIVGTGPLEQKLRALAGKQPNSGAIEWLGTMKNDAVQRLIAESDCLVLPSEYDGWGAVVSEALLAGTPVICSSACGAAVAVEQAPAGSVFTSGNASLLAAKLRAQLTLPPVSTAQRALLQDWASLALCDQAGARYLEAIVASIADNAPPPPAPWTLSHALEKPQEIKTFVTR